MTWLLVAWLCAASGECRPVQAGYPSRGACLRAERTVKAQAKSQDGPQLTAVHCHRVRPVPVS